MKVVKTVDGKPRPASDFLVVVDPQKPSTWHLPVKRNGKPDHNLMGAAHGALMNPNYRGGKPYAGPNKQEAITKLKALYKSEGMPWPSAKESDAGRSPNLIESARLLEAVEGSEGLEWEIECIEAGMSANRKMYTAEVLQSALPLFEGLTSYANHPSKAEMQEGLERDITKMAGWVTNVRWDPSGGKGNRGAVVGIYHALKAGPIAKYLQEAWERNNPSLVQFSILGDGKQRVMKDANSKLYYHVEAINDLYNLDAVGKGAAGGRVRSLVASAREEVEELEKKIEELTREELVELRPDLFEDETISVQDDEIIQESVSGDEKDEDEKEVALKESEKAKAPDENKNTESAALKEVENVTGEVKVLREEMQKLVAINRAHFLNEQIGGAELPAQVKAQIRKRYEGMAFVESDVVSDIAENVKVWAEVLREQPRMQTRQVGPDSVDKLLSAVEGMLAGKDVDDVPRFRGIKEAFHKVTGAPYDMGRSEYVSRVLGESANFASWMKPNLREAELREAISWTSVLGVSMYRRLIAEYRLPIYDEWKYLVSEISDLSDMKEQLRERTGYYGILPAVAKGGTYQPLTSPGEEQANFTPGKYGGLESWDWEDALNDDLDALKKIPKKLALTAKITLYQFVLNFLRDGATTAVTYGAAANLFSATHANVGTDALGTVGITNAVQRMRSQTALSSTATFLAVRPKHLWVPNELETLADHLYKSPNYVPATIDGVNNVVVNNPHEGKYQPHVVDYWTTANRWFMSADTNLVPTIEVGFLDGREEPELFSLAEDTGSAATADQVIWKLRHAYGGGILDHKGLDTSIG